MKKILGSLLVGMASAHAQVVVPDLPALQLGQGAYSRRFTDAFSFAVNPASLADGPSAVGLMTTRKFGLKELNAVQFTGALAMAGGGMGLRLHYNGHPALYQMQAGLAYGKALGTLDLGVELGYLALQVPGYGNDGAVQTAAGFRVPLGPGVFAGLRVANFLGGRFRYRSAERLARVVEGALGYEVSEQVFLSISLIKAETRPMLFLFYLEYRWLEKGVFRTGINALVHSPWIGLGWQFGHWQPGLQVAYHPVLGFSPAIQLTHSLKKERS